LYRYDAVIEDVRVPLVTENGEDSFYGLMVGFASNTKR
jgi:hypothetical protein